MSKTKNIVIGVLIALLGLWFAAVILATPARAATLTSAQTQAILSLLSSFGADSATIANVQAALTGEGTAVPSTLKIGSTGSAVTALQKELIAQGYDIPAITKSGVAYGYYGNQTAAAVAKRAAAVPVVPVVPSATAYTVSANSGTAVLVSGQAIANLGAFTFSNPTAKDVKVTNVALSRIGVSNDSTLKNVYLYNGATRLTDSAGVSNAAINFNSSEGIFVVKAGGTYVLSVRADLGDSSGQQVGVSLTGVTSDGVISTSLPVNTGYQSISSAEMATVDFNSTTLPTGTEVNPQTDLVVWQNSVSISTHAVDLKSLQLRVMGSVKSTDIGNLRLYVDGVQVGSSATISSTDLVTFDLTSSPKRLETGTRVLKVVGDIVAGSGETFQFSLRRSADIQIMDVDLGQYVLVKAGGSSFSARAAGVSDIAEGTMSVVKANTSPSSDVSLNGSSVKFASFEFRASGEDIKVESLDIKVDNTTGSAGLNNGKIFLNGSQIGSTKDLLSTVTTFDLNSSMVLKAGQVAIVDIYADAKKADGNSYVNGNQAKIVLSGTTGNAQRMISSTSLKVPENEISGSIVTMTDSSASVTKYSGFGDKIVIAGSTDTKIGSFVLSTGSTEGVNVNTLTFTNLSDTKISDLKIVSNGSQIGSIKPTVSSSNSFSVNINMAASATKIIDVYANVKSTATGSFTASVDGTGTGTVTGNSVTLSSSALQTITIGNGQLTASVNSGSTPNNSLVLAGSSVKVGSFNFTAQYSPYTIDKILVKIPNNSATSVASITLKGNGLPTEGVSGAINVLDGAYSKATFTGLTFNIPAGNSKALDVYFNLNSIQADLDIGKAVSVVLAANEGFRATDSSGAASTTMATADLNSAANDGKGTVFVRKSIPTLSAVALDSSVLTAGSQKVIAKVKVTADSAGDISWSKMVFTLGKSSAVTVSNFKLYSGSSLVDATSTPAGDYIVFEPSEQQVSGSETYELRADVGGTLSSNSYVDVSIANPGTLSVGTASSVDGSFVWSDRSAVSGVHSTSTTDWTNDYLVKTLPLTVGNLNAN